VEEKPSILTPGRIRRLRKKIGISQKELASLTGVSTGAVLSWEKGKFRPKEEKMTQLLSFAEKGKEDIRKLLSEKMPKREKKSGESQAGKPKGREGVGQKVVPPQKKKT